MEYVYSAMLLHKAGKQVTEESLTKVLSAAGVKADAGRVKAIVSALSEVDIDEAIKAAPVAAAPAPAAPAPAEEKRKEEKPKKEERKEEEVTGLGALFG